MLSWMIFGTSIQSILNFVLVIGIILGVIFLLIKVPGSRMIISGVMVLMLVASGVFSGIKLNEYYNAEGGVFGKLDDIIHPNKVEITDNVTNIDFDFSQVVLTGTDETMYTASFISDNVLRLDSDEYYKVSVNGDPCKVISYTDTSLVATYNYAFYDVKGLILSDELKFTFGFNRYSTDLVVSTTGNANAVDLWNSYFDKNQFKVNISTSSEPYVSESKQCTLKIMLENEVVDTKLVPVGTDVTLSTMPEIEGKRFIGYSFNGVDIIEGDTITVSFSRKVFAIYKDLHLVKFYNITESETNYEKHAEDVYYIDGEYLSDEEVWTPTRANFDFMGWSLDGKNVIDLTKTIYNDKITELYAVWQSNSVLVNVDLNGGTLTHNGISYSSSFSFTQRFDSVINFEDLSKDGYTFELFHVNFEPMGITNTVTSATFSRNLNSVYYKNNDPNFIPSPYGPNSGSPSIKEDLGYEYDLVDSTSVEIVLYWVFEDYTSDCSTLSDNDLGYFVMNNIFEGDYSKDIYYFDNVSNEDVLDIVIIDKFALNASEINNMTWSDKVTHLEELFELGVNSDISARDYLEALYSSLWSETHSNVVFMVDEDVYSTQNLENGSCATLPSEPSKYGYAFKGWSLDGINLIEDIETTEVTSDVTYIAVFKSSSPVLDKNFFNYITQMDYLITSANVSSMSFLTSSDKENKLGMLPSGIDVFYSKVGGYYELDFVAEKIFAPTIDSLFAGYKELKSLDFSNFDTSNVTAMMCWFGYSSSLKSLDLSGFDTSNVTSMYYMFAGCNSLTTLDLSNFNTSNVTDMTSLFYSCHNLSSVDLSNFNTSNVTCMAGMFYNCSSLTTLNLSNFNVSNVTSFGSMFYGCSGLTILDLSNFVTSALCNTYRMFYNCKSLTTLNLSNFDTGKVTASDSMFINCQSSLTITIGSNYTLDNLSGFNVINTSSSGSSSSSGSGSGDIYVKED